MSGDTTFIKFFLMNNGHTIFCGIESSDDPVRVIWMGKFHSLFKQFSIHWSFCKCAEVEISYTIVFYFRIRDILYFRIFILEREYVAFSFHFHWGEKNSAGSEHTINNHFYPIEVQKYLSKQSEKFF